MKFAVTLFSFGQHSNFIDVLLPLDAFVFSLTFNSQNRHPGEFFLILQRPKFSAFIRLRGTRLNISI